jgi:hypothetical protein
MWLAGEARERIIADNDIGAGTISIVVDDYKAGLDKLSKTTLNFFPLFFELFQNKRFIEIKSNLVSKTFEIETILCSPECLVLGEAIDSIS